MRHTILPTLLLTVGLGLSAGCADEELGRESVEDAGLELVPISELDAMAFRTFEGLRSEAEDIGLLDLVWDGIDDPRVAYVEIWRPNMDKWAALSGGDWLPAVEEWGDLVTTLPAGPARWTDPDALVFTDNRYVLRTLGVDRQPINGFVIKAKPARAGLRAANWADQDTNGVGTHDIDGEYVNIRGDNLDQVLFMANRGDLGTISYATQSEVGKTYFEIFFKSGVHAGKRGWVAQEFLRWTVLEVCGDDVLMRDGDSLDQIVGTVSTGDTATVVSGKVRNTGQYRYFRVSSNGVEGWVATDFLCPKGSAGSSGQGNYDVATAQALADQAFAGNLGYSIGACYEYVWNALKAVVGITEGRADQIGVPVASAYQFGDWADQNPGLLYSDFGLQAINSSAANAPVGSVVVWDPGQCGFSSIHGHIEIVVSPGYACSDFCGYMYDTCGNPRVYMPVN